MILSFSSISHYSHIKQNSGNQSSILCVLLTLTSQYPSNWKKVKNCQQLNEAFLSRYKNHKTNFLPWGRPLNITISLMNIIKPKISLKKSRESMILLKKIQNNQCLCFQATIRVRFFPVIQPEYVGQRCIQDLVKLLRCIFFSKIVIGFQLLSCHKKLLIIFLKNCCIDIWLGSEYVSAYNFRWKLQFRFCFCLYC